jgi:hypothetical protein
MNGAITYGIILSSISITSLIACTIIINAD